MLPKHCRLLRFDGGASARTRNAHGEGNSPLCVAASPWLLFLRVYAPSSLSPLALVLPAHSDILPENLRVGLGTQTTRLQVHRLP